MKVKTMTVLAFAILAAAPSRAESVADPKTEKVTEAAFRQQVTFWLNEHGRQSGVVVCLAVEQAGATRSVTQEYLRRFTDPAVRRAVDCETRAAGPVERATGRPAVMVTVGAITWPAPDEAWVTVRYSRRLSSGSQQYRIVKEQARWICLGPIVKLSPA